MDSKSYKQLKIRQVVEEIGYYDKALCLETDDNK